MLRRKKVGAPDAGQGKGGSGSSRPNGEQDPRKINQERGEVQTLSLEDLRALFGGETSLSGLELRCPGPGHSSVDRSMSIRITDDGDLLVNSFANDPKECRDHVVDEILTAWCSSNHPTTWWERLDLVREMIGGPGAVRERPVVEEKTPAERTESAMRIWREAVDPRGTLVEAYLRSRLVRLPAEAAGQVIRFHGNCPFGRRQRTSAMIALVRDIETDQPVAIHRTALTLKGEKAMLDIGNGEKKSRLAMGPTGRGAVKLCAPTTILGVGEGIETVLSFREYDDLSSLPVWSLLSEAGLRPFPLVEGVRNLWIAEDDDQAGITATAIVRRRWLKDGREVRIAGPRGTNFKSAARGVVPDLNDLNDLLRAEASQ